MTWKAHVITLLPEAFPGLLGHALSGRALEKGIWSLNTVALRDFGRGKHKDVDDTPSGGGAGMVIRADVACAAIDAVQAGAQSGTQNLPIIALSPRGKPLTQAKARALAAGDGVILFCARFEGVDERIFATRDIEEVSIGDYILSGGEGAAQILLDAVVRLLPGVMGAPESGVEESFEDDLLEYPHYTRPQAFEGAEIPAVLTSGDHAKVAAWRREQAEKLTQSRRPDLWARHGGQPPAKSPEKPEKK